VTENPSYLGNYVTADIFSSNTADPVVNVCDDFTENAFCYWVFKTLFILIIPAQRAFPLLGSSGKSVGYGVAG